MRPLTRSELPIGAVLSDKYRITREIGRGGMAAVYEAEHVDIGKRLAVKVLDPSLAGSATIVERFQREARAAAAVNSPYICDVHDAGRLPDGRPYLVLELLEGESLYDRMSHFERLSPAEVVRILGQVARGLQKAHSAGIVHRDLKPENIFLARDGDGQEIAKIVDFGLAKMFGTAGSPEANPRLTREGAIFGTPMYMSPEQIGGQGQADHRSDLWAMGCIAFECLTGRPVWNVDQGVALIFGQIATAPVPIPSELTPSLPPTFDAWVRRALARDPDERFQSALELAQSLAVALGQDVAMAMSSSVIVARSPSTNIRLSAATQAEEHDERVEPFAPTEPPPDPKPRPEPARSRVTAPRTPTDLVAPLPAAPRTEPIRSAPRSSRTPIVAALSLAVVAAGVGGFLLTRRAGPAAHSAGPIASSPATIASPAAAASSSAPVVASSSIPGNPLPIPAFAVPIVKAERLMADSKPEDAVHVLEQAAESSDSGALLTMLDNVRLAAANTGPCRVTALARPRPFEWTSSLRGPSIASGSSGIVVSWVDNQNDKQRWDLWAERLGQDLVPIDQPVDMLPSAGNIDNGSIVAAGDGFVVVFGDDAIGTRGAYLRRLDASGKPVGPTQRLSPNKASVPHPSVVALGDGTVAAVFADAAKAGPADIMLQRFHADLTATGPAVAVARYAVPSSRQSGSSPSIAVAGDRLVIAWRRDTIQEQAIVLRAVRVSDGSVVWPATDEQGVVVSEPRGKVRAPELSCAGDSCLVTWRREPTGSYIAAVDATSGKVRWRKILAPGGTQIGASLQPGGEGLVAWYDGGRVRAARVDDSGAGEGSIIGQSHGEQATPLVVPTSRAGEWLLSWTCFEAGHPEAFVTRLSCGR